MFYCLLLLKSKKTLSTSLKPNKYESLQPHPFPFSLTLLHCPLQGQTKIIRIQKKLMSSEKDSPSDVIFIQVGMNRANVNATVLLCLSLKLRNDRGSGRDATRTTTLRQRQTHGLGQAWLMYGCMEGQRRIASKIKDTQCITPTPTKLNEPPREKTNPKPVWNQF